LVERERDSTALNEETMLPELRHGSYPNLFLKYDSLSSSIWSPIHYAKCVRRISVHIMYQQRVTLCSRFCRL